MKKIYKFPIQQTGKQKIYGNGLIPLCVQVQHGVPCIWGAVDDDEPPAGLEIVTYGTGYEIEYNREDIQYLGSYQLYGGDFVGHVFVVIF